MRKKINADLVGGFKTEELSVKTEIGFYTMRRILKGEREITKAEQLALVSATGIREEELFIVVEDDKQAS